MAAWTLRLPISRQWRRIGAGRDGTRRTPATLLVLMPAEFGIYDGLATLGGANPNNDGRYIEGVTPGARDQTAGFGESLVDFLKNRAGKLGKPFCLFVSLVNPHARHR